MFNGRVLHDGSVLIGCWGLVLRTQVSDSLLLGRPGDGSAAEALFIVCVSAWKADVRRLRAFPFPALCVVQQSVLIS